VKIYEDSYREKLAILADNRGKSELNPVKIYKNADLDKCLILSENSGKSVGVYEWLNKTNKKTYIGSSYNLAVRLRAYFNTNYSRVGRMRRGGETSDRILAPPLTPCTLSQVITEEIAE